MLFPKHFINHYITSVLFFLNVSLFIKVTLILKYIYQILFKLENLWFDMFSNNSAEQSSVDYENSTVTMLPKLIECETML